MGTAMTVGEIMQCQQNVVNEEFYGADNMYPS
jgi:hypothetical protein